MAPTQVAVIGTGASAFGAVNALEPLVERGLVSVTVIGPDDGSVDRKSGFPPGDPREWAPEDYDELHRRVKSGISKQFPPPRSQFGATLNRCLPEEDASLFQTFAFGGMGEFWSTAMFPLRQSDLKAWPISFGDLEPYYRAIADRVGVAGDPDAFPGMFPRTFVNRPPVQPTPLAGHLVETFSSDRDPRYRAVGGTNLLGVETRPDQARACVYCGGCLYGCFKGSMFRPGPILRRWIEEGTLQHVPVAARSVDRLPSGRLQVRLADGGSPTFDRVFLCAGALGSSEVLLRTMGAADTEVVISDNEMYNFPIAYTGLRAKTFTDHFAISTSVLALEPTEAAEPEVEYGHVLITSLPGKLLDFYVRKRMWRPFMWPRRQLRGRFLIAQMYVGGATAVQYGLRVGPDGEKHLRGIRRGASDEAGRRQIQAVKRNVRGTRFTLPPFPLKRASTSFHYFGGFGPGNPLTTVGAGGQIMPGLYVCDSSVFPNSPAQPFTFTLMANAMRIVTSAMDD